MEKETKKHLLLVDDETIILETLKHGLEVLGYQITAYSNPETAVTNYTNDQPDLIIVDYNMPGINGLQLTQKLNEILHRPVLMLSAYAELPVVKEAIGAGVSGYLVKPVEAERLLPTIEATLARFSEMAALLEQGANIQAGVEAHRLISTAVGILMSRANLSQDQAFQNLRRLSRNRRQPLKEIAFDLVDATSTVNEIIQESTK